MFSLRLIVLSVGILFLVGASNVMAAGSGGLRVESPDAATIGMGNAFVGEANRPSAVYYNPAGLTQIKSTEVSVGVALLAPQSDYKNTAGDTTQMRRNTFFIPHLYAAVPIIDKLTIGLGTTSYFGLGTEWAQDSNLRYVSTESVIENKDYMLTAAYQVTDQWTFAVSADNDDTKASKAKKLQQASGTDANFQLKAKDDAWGYRIATMFKVNNQHQFGLMYRSSISHRYEGKAYIDGLDASPTLFGMGLSSNSYSGVFGGSSYETRLSEKFTLPQSVVIGYSFKPTSKWTFNLDLEWMDWSSVKHDAINWLDETDASRLAILNGGNPEARDWKSVWSEAVGAEYAATDRLRLRGGYYHHATPISQNTLHSNLPDANSHGIATGFGYDLTKHLTVDVAYSAIFYETRKVTSDINSAINGTYKQFVNTAYLTLTYKF